MTTIRFTGDIKKFEGFINSRRWAKILEQEVRKGTADNISLILKEIDDKIQKGNHKPLSELSKLLKMKPGDKPLIDTSDMLRALDFELKDSFNGKVGFLKNTKTSHGSTLKKVVPMLESGFTVRITAKMRRWLMHNAAAVGITLGGTPGNKSTGKIVVPGRPFITPIFKSKRIQRIVNRNWELAVERAMKRMGAL